MFSFGKGRSEKSRGVLLSNNLFFELRKRWVVSSIDAFFHPISGGLEMSR